MSVLGVMEVINRYELTKEESVSLDLLTTHFNIHFNRTVKYSGVFSSLAISLDTKAPREVWCLITNTARALRYGARGLKIPRSPRFYVGNTQRISCSRMNTVLDRLVELDYLVFYRGGVVSFKSEEVVQSVFMFTKKYLDLWEKVRLVSEEDLLEPILLKDRVTGDTLAIEKCPTNLVRGICRYNKALTHISLSLDGDLLPTQQYKRIFNGSLTKGGRYYNTVGGIQTMPAHNRQRLQINGEDVVELDFKALHPSILYDKLVQEEPLYASRLFHDKYDPYDIDIDFIPVDAEKVEFIRSNYKPTYNPMRNLVKSVILVGLNAVDLKSAYLSIANMLYEDKRKYWDSNPEKAKYYGIVIERDSHGGSRFPAKMLCEYVQSEHEPIAQHFFSDKGIELQFIDSEIISHVLTALMEDNEILLSEHDSIIVRKSIAAHAEEMMQQAYKEVVGSDRFCYIERK